jgi:hypothetical protein
VGRAVVAVQPGERRTHTVQAQPGVATLNLLFSPSPPKGAIYKAYKNPPGPLDFAGPVGGLSHPSVLSPRGWDIVFEFAVHPAPGSIDPPGQSVEYMILVFQRTGAADSVDCVSSDR